MSTTGSTSPCRRARRTRRASSRRRPATCRRPSGTSGATTGLRADSCRSRTVPASSPIPWRSRRTTGSTLWGLLRRPPTARLRALQVLERARRQVELRLSRQRPEARDDPLLPDDARRRDESPSGGPAEGDGRSGRRDQGRGSEPRGRVILRLVAISSAGRVHTTSAAGSARPRIEATPPNALKEPARGSWTFGVPRCMHAHGDLWSTLASLVDAAAGARARSRESRDLAIRTRERSRAIVAQAAL